MFYCLDDNNNKIEALDKEGVYSVLDQAIKDGSLENLVADAAFVSKLKCCVSGQTNKVAFTNSAKYNELKAANALEENCYYFITDDTSVEDIDTELKAINDAIASTNERVRALEEKMQRVLAQLDG